MQCKVLQQSDLDSNLWDTFVLSNSMGWAYYLYDMIGVDRESTYKNLSFAIVDIENNNEILFIMQLHYFEERPIKKAFLIKEKKLSSRWGFVIKDNLPKRQLRLIKECFENHIDSYIQEHHIRSFEINLPPLTDANLNNIKAINPLIFFNFKPSIRYTYVVDLSKPNDRLLADCEETTRQAIRKLDASNKYIIREAEACEEDCNIFIKLHKETYTRTNAKSDIIEDSYHHHMFFTLIPKKICRVFFLVDKETKNVVASVAILIYKKTAYYWWGDSKNEKEIGVNKYLLFKVIYLIRDSFEKTGLFETGGAYPYLRKGKYKGLNDFKKCFGTSLYIIWGGTYSIPISSLKLRIKKILQMNN